MIGGLRLISHRLISLTGEPPLLRPRRRFISTSCSMAPPPPKKKVIVISGPTGAGKSRLALEVAKRLNGEIISADSIQVYKGLDVGSAKPSINERQEVPHHLVDILHPSEEYSVGQFYEDARRITDEILSRDCVPIVTGGTGLYLRWFIYGKPDVPKASAEVAFEVHTELADLQRVGDWESAVRLVENAGDPGVSSLASNDWYRLRRRFEILKSSGASPSAIEVPYNSFKEKMESREAKAEEDEPHERKPKELDYEFLCFFLSTQRLDLYRAIDFRCEDMLLDDGILSEAKWLVDLGLLPNTNSATRAIGYRHAMEYLLFSGEQGGSSSPKDFNRFLSEFQRASRNFAKRQLTWFRNEPMYQWVDASKPLESVLGFICDAYDDETGTLELPRGLRMEKESSPKETRLLKSYRTKNRHFVTQGDCSSILEWVRRTRAQTTASVF